MLAIDRLIEAVEKTHNPSVMGLDPRPELIPPELEAKIRRAEDLPKAYLAFNQRLLEACQGLVPAVKFQVACYEAFGLDGLKALKESQSIAQELGYFVINDAKRSDIASSATFYARAWLQDEAWTGDALTINPYLGRDSIEPFMELAKENDKMLFVLLRTSNPGAKDFQDLVLKDGRRLYEVVGEQLQTWGESRKGKYGYSDLGAVVGATWPEEGGKLRQALPSVYFLVPGYGSQGGTAADVAPCFDDQGRGALVNSSRGLIAAWKRYDVKDFAEATRQAAEAMAEDLRSALKEVQA